MSDYRNWNHQDDYNYGDYGQWGREDQDWRGNDDKNDWKRRKTNDDGYQSVSYPRGHDDGYGEENYDEYSHSRDREAHRRPRAVPSDPSEHVIFLGLDPDFTESDLHAYLTSGGFNLENVTIIRDRATGMSKSFGFAQFVSVSEAQRFLEPNFPFVLIPPPSHAITAPFYNDDGSRSRRVKIDFSQSANPSDGSSRRQGPRGPSGSNDGTRDIGSAHVPVVLLRGLEVGSTLDTIAEALRASEGPGRKSAKGMKRILLMKDKISKISLGFAFVEFVDIASASSVLANTMSPTLFPSGFRISGKPVAASFAHLHSFQLAPSSVARDETCIDATSSLGGQDSGFAKYWDDNAVISELLFEVEDVAAPVTKKAKDRKKERAKVTGLKDVGDHGISKPLAPTALKDTAAPISLSLKSNKAAESRPTILIGGATTSKLAPAFGFGDDVADSEEIPSTNGTQQPEDRTTSYRKVAPMIASKKVANDISKWNTVKEAQGENVVDTDAARLTADSLNSTPESAPAPSSTPSSTIEFEYGDLKKMACLLCSRQFKTVDQLRRHNAESELHKKNLQVDSLRDIARTKAATARKAATTPDAETAPKYRDRALERRAVYGQPDVPVASTSNDNGFPHKRKFGEASTVVARPPTPPPPPIVHPGEDENNVGNKLLKKMGWSAGNGLGLSGEGRVAPIPTAIYAQGVGLGASKGKEIGTGVDPFDYASSVKESARERFGSR